MITIQLNSPVPLLDQIVAAVRSAIAMGTVKPGDPLPTVRQLAADLGVNQNTVARAYRELEAAGLVSSVRGRGTVVTASAETKTQPEARRVELTERLRTLLADAKLAGLSRGEIQAFLQQHVSQFWQEEDK